MGKEKFRPFQMMRGTKKNVLGWQYEMIYLGGDPCNPDQAIVHVRTLEKAVVVRAADGREETFCSMMIPYVSVIGVELMDEETGRRVAIGEKGSIGDVFEKVFLKYNDNGTLLTLELRMSMAADIYQNSKLCRNMQEYVASKLKKTK